MNYLIALIVYAVIGCIFAFVMEKRFYPHEKFEWGLRVIVAVGWPFGMMCMLSDWVDEHL